MKRKLYLLGFILFLTGGIINAQYEFKPGKINTLDKKSIAGFIYYGTDAQMTDSIMFKKDLASESYTRYRPHELTGFRFDSYREFKSVKISNENTQNKDSVYVFAKYLAKGKVDLLIHRHEKIMSYDFVVYNNSNQRKAKLSKPVKTKVVIDGRDYNKKDQRYQNLLNYVKDIKPDQDKKSRKTRYGEKSIVKDITSYNDVFRPEYPTFNYKEPTKFNYGILVGLPITFKGDWMGFRAEFYRSKVHVDKSNRFASYASIIYHHWEKKDPWKWTDDYQYSSSNYKRQLLNVVPVGVMFQSRATKIIPYGHIGLGVGLLVDTNYIIENFVASAEETEIFLIPTINFGAGLKIKVGSNYLLTEITPTISGVFLNLGYAF